MTDQLLHPDDEIPRLQRLQPRHVQQAKALVREVWREHFQSHDEAFVRDFLLLPNALDDIEEAASIDSATSLFVVLEVCGGSVIGTGAIRGVSEDICELSRMFIARSWRRRGLATTLMHYLLDFARVTNFKIVRLESNRGLAASHQFYRAFGFCDCPSWVPQADGHSITMELTL
jgi:GNAT superfamily N-acetyltransferase